MFSWLVVLRDGCLAIDANERAVMLARQHCEGERGKGSGTKQVAYHHDIINDRVCIE